MVYFTPDGDAEPAVEILLVQHDRKQCELTLDVIQSHHLAKCVHVLRDGGEALDFLFRVGAYVGRKPTNPRLVLFQLRLAEGEPGRLASIKSINASKPRTSGSRGMSSDSMRPSRMASAQSSLRRSCSPAASLEP